ncbi:MAG: tetratricopeptide repeat protein [Chloroflexota bacterium]
MPKTLHFTLLGQAEISFDDESRPRFVTSKAKALLIYLAVTGHPHSRDALAGLLWPDVPDKTAKKNLRDILPNLKKLVGDYLLITRQTLAINPDSPIWLDVGLFRSALDNQPSFDNLRALQEIVELYQGDFVAGFYVKEAEPFEEWVLGQREWLRGLAIQNLHVLGNEYSVRGEYAAGIEVTNRLLALEPWREESHRQMMLLLARSGQRSDALAQYELCKQILADELGVDPQPETTTLYNQLKASGEAPPHNLPPQPTMFIGRQTELAQLNQYLEGTMYRLISLVGPGGIGKTRLALHAASGKIGRFLHGNYLVSLAPITSYDPLISAIADAIGLTFQGKADIKQQLIAHLHSKEMLIILDNFEQLLRPPPGETKSGLDLIIELLTKARHLTFLITSREQLNLQEEWVVRLEGLPYPDKMWLTDRRDQNISDIVTDVELFSAIQLFTQQARRGQASFALTEEALPNVIRLCQLVQGQPLGVELAASWTRTLSAAEIVAEVKKSLDFLTTSLRNVPERHRSLRAVFDSSWELLSPQEQTALAGLSIFRGGFEREAAIKVVDTSLLTLTALLDKSLLQRLASGRYEIHERLRQYAFEKLEEQSALKKEGETALTELNLSEHIQFQHSLYQLEFLSARNEVIHSNKPQQAIAEVWVELDNIRQGWVQGVSSPEIWHWIGATSGQIAKLDQAITCLSRFYDMSGLFQEGAASFGDSADRLNYRLDDDEIAQETRFILSRLLIERAYLLNRCGQYETAIGAAHAAAGLAYAVEAKALEALARHEWGDALLRQGNYTLARERFNQALVLAREANIPAKEGEILRHLGILVNDQGDPQEAQAILEEALILFHQIGDQRGESLVLNNLAIIARRQGDYQAAQTAYQEALSRFRDLEDRRGESMVLANSGVVAYELGNYYKAQQRYEQALDLARAIKERSIEGSILENLGDVFRQQGAYELAESYYAKSLQLRREIGDRLGKGYVLYSLALLTHLQGDHQATEAYSQQALQIGEAMAIDGLQAMALTTLGHALVSLGQLTTAKETYELSYQIHQQLGEYRQAIEPLAGLARIALASDNLPQALTYVSDIMPALETNPSYNFQEPLRIFLTCYQVLEKDDDPWAWAVLETAYHLLEQRADMIIDDTLRYTYLNEVAIHCHIIEEFHRHQD